MDTCIFHVLLRLHTLWIWTRNWQNLTSPKTKFKCSLKEKNPLAFQLLSLKFLCVLPTDYLFYCHTDNKSSRKDPPASKWWQNFEGIKVCWNPHYCGKTEKLAYAFNPRAVRTCTGSYYTQGYMALMPQWMLCVQKLGKAAPMLLIISWHL